MIANEIYRQLGSTFFCMITGAKDFIILSNGLKFSISGRTINHVQITLNGNDMYDVMYGKVTKSGYSVIREFDNVYASDLLKNFTQVTGLHTKL